MAFPPARGCSLCHNRPRWHARCPVAHVARLRRRTLSQDESAWRSPAKPQFIGIRGGEHMNGLGVRSKLQPSLAAAIASSAEAQRADHAGDLLARLPRARPPRRMVRRAGEGLLQAGPASTSPSSRARAPRRRSRAWNRRPRSSPSPMSRASLRRAPQRRDRQDGRGDLPEVALRDLLARSGANVTKPEQLENLEIGSGAGSVHARR